MRFNATQSTTRRMCKLEHFEMEAAAIRDMLRKRIEGRYGLQLYLQMPLVNMLHVAGLSTQVFHERTHLQNKHKHE